MTQARLDALVAFGLACVLALWLTPIAARIATHVGLVDRRSSDRRLHTKPIPFGGGIAMFVAVAVPVLLLQPSLGGRAHAILLGACVCAAVGLLDDRFEIDPFAKFAGEIVAAAIPVAAGATIDHLTLPLLHPLDLGALQYPVTMLWIVALMNSFNFIDGMDGLAAGVGAITASTFAILALSLNRGGAAVLAAALAGACLGFLRYNFHPARVFMGDAGSLTLGYLLAVIAIQGVLKTAAAVALLFPTLVLLVPIFDTSFVLLHRIKYGRAPWSADANHLHHRFVRVGFGQRRAALALYAWCALLAGCALAVRFLPWHTHDQVHLGATLILAGLGVGRARRDGLDRGRARGRQAAPPAAVRAGAARRHAGGHARDRGLAPPPRSGRGQALSAEAARAAAVRAALELVEPGMRLGLGSGRAVFAHRAMRSATSSARPELVRLRLARDGASGGGRRPAGGRSPEEAPELDLALDGADEVTRDLAVLKGGGGALLREKLVFECRGARVIVAEARKLVGRLGEGWRLPVEVVRFGWEGTRLRLLELLADAQRRSADDGTPFVTDEGHLHPGLRDPARVRSARARPPPSRRSRAWSSTASSSSTPTPSLLGAPDGSLRATGQVVNCTGCRQSMCGPIISLTMRRCSG